MKRIPLTSVQKAIYTRLKECQTTPIYDGIPDNKNLVEMMPFIEFGAFTCAMNEQDTKDLDITRCTIQLDIWSAKKGKKEVQTIANDLIYLLEYSTLELEDNFKVIEQGVTFFEVFTEDYNGYHGVITLELSIKNEG